jgi:hypothetical protein
VCSSSVPCRAEPNESVKRLITLQAVAAITVTDGRVAIGHASIRVVNGWLRCSCPSVVKTVDEHSRILSVCRFYFRHAPLSLDCTYAGTAVTQPRRVPASAGPSATLSPRPRPLGNIAVTAVLSVADVVAVCGTEAALG